MEAFALRSWRLCVRFPILLGRRLFDEEMDPITHTLTGAALARAGLGRRSAFAGGALLISANLPDIDALSYFFGGTDAALGFRRGWTHGILAILLLPVLLWALVLLFDRAKARSRTVSPPLRRRVLLGICYLGLLSHPLLDWLNNYGVRLLMPFDGRWFYGDSVFIVDPWIWLLLGTGVLLSGPRGRVRLALWAAFAVFSTFLMAIGAPAPLRAVQWIWPIALSVVTVFHLSGRPRTSSGRRRAVWAALTLTGLYVGLMTVSAWYARDAVAAELAARGVRAESLMVAPVAVNPFRREFVAATADGYRYGDLELLPSWQLRLNPRLIPLPQRTPIVQRALDSPQVAGLVCWARFPFVEVEEEDDRYRVYILDARYTRQKMTGFGGELVEVEKR